MGRREWQDGGHGGGVVGEGWHLYLLTSPWISDLGLLMVWRKLSAVAISTPILTLSLHERGEPFCAGMGRRSNERYGGGSKVGGALHYKCTLVGGALHYKCTLVGGALHYKCTLVGGALHYKCTLVGGALHYKCTLVGGALHYKCTLRLQQRYGTHVCTQSLPVSTRTSHPSLCAHHSPYTYPSPSTPPVPTTPPIPTPSPKIQFIHIPYMYIHVVPSVHMCSHSLLPIPPPPPHLAQ